MRTLLLSFIFFYVLLQADELRQASAPCEVFNNIRHTKNSGHQLLKKGESYHIIREQNGQYYITIPNIPVPNRWVEKSCFSKEGIIGKQSAKKQDLNVKTYTGIDAADVERPEALLLALSWHNAFCEVHRSRRECRETRGSRYSDIRFVLHGLWPQPRDNIYCNVPQTLRQYDKNRQWHRLPILPLSDGTLTALLHLMPGSASNLHRHEWVKHGTCYRSDPESYFREAISLTEQVNRSKIGLFFSQNIGKTVTLKQIRFKVDESFGKGSGKKVEMKCNKGMVTELWFHLGNGSGELSQLLKKGKSVRSRCHKGRIDRAGFR